MPNSAIARGAAVLVCLAAAGCDENPSSLTGPTPDLRATFSSIQEEIFENGDSTGRPACTQCHNPGGARFNGLDLSHDVAYGNLVGIASRGKPGAIRVVAGDAESSYIVHKLEGRSDIVGARMPNGGPYLTDGQIFVIKRWIDLGAARD
jgi:hypothetical protein